MCANQWKLMISFTLWPLYSYVYWFNTVWYGDTILDPASNRILNGLSNHYIARATYLAILKLYGRDLD